MDKDEKIKELKKQCLQCNGLNEIRKILFEITKLKDNAKNVTGIAQNAVDEFTRNEIIKICQNINPNEKTELIKTLNLSKITFEEVLSIFDKANLLQAIKEFNVRVTKENLQDIEEKSSSNEDRKFIELLIDSNISEPQTITEIVLKNFKEDKLIEIIKDYNLKLDSEQLQKVINQSKKLKPQQQDFIEKVSFLAKKNDEISNTINYKILNEKFKGLEKYLPIITCHPSIQESIINLNDKQYQVFQTCLDYYSDITPDWTPVAAGMLKNLSQYTKLINTLDEKSFTTPEKIALLTKVVSEPNYFSIENIEDYLEKRNQVCSEILENPNSESLQVNEYLKNLSEIDKVKFAMLEQNYGISLYQAQELVKKFAYDIHTLTNTPKSEKYNRLIQNLKFICNCQDTKELAIYKNNPSNVVLNANLIERELKDEYDREYREKLYRPNDRDLLSQEEMQKYLLGETEDGISFYLAGKSNNGNFFMESHAPGAVYGDDLIAKQQYQTAWNKPKMQSQAFCTHLTSNQMLLSNIKNVEYGFYNYENGSLRAAGYEDISSDYTHFTGFTDNDEKISSMQQRIDHTRNNDESDRARILPDGTKRQPDYVRLLKSRHLEHLPKDNLAHPKNKLKNAKIVAKQFGIPIVIIDQDKCTKQENDIIRNMLKEFEKTKNPELISTIITRFENNRIGNLWNNIDFSIDSNSKTDEFGKSIITRNEMLIELINTIEKSSNRQQLQNLYKSLNDAIVNEVSKFKHPGYKILNDEGIPIVQKEPIKIEEYFGMKRNKENGKFIPETAISSYEKFMQLRSKCNEFLFSEQEIGTINMPTKNKDSAKKQVYNDEFTLQQAQVKDNQLE